jgi:hypothetical protein
MSRCYSYAARAVAPISKPKKKEKKENKNKKQRCNDGSKKTVKTRATVLKEEIQKMYDVLTHYGIEISRKELRKMKKTSKILYNRLLKIVMQYDIELKEDTNPNGIIMFGFGGNGSDIDDIDIKDDTIFFRPLSKHPNLKILLPVGDGGIAIERIDDVIRALAPTVDIANSLLPLSIEKKLYWLLQNGHIKLTDRCNYLSNYVMIDDDNETAHFITTKHARKLMGRVIILRNPSKNMNENLAKVKSDYFDMIALVNKLKDNINHNKKNKKNKKENPNNKQKPTLKRKRKTDSSDDDDDDDDDDESNSSVDNSFEYSSQSSDSPDVTSDTEENETSNESSDHNESDIDHTDDYSSTSTDDDDDDDDSDNDDTSNDSDNDDTSNDDYHQHKDKNKK